MTSSIGKWVWACKPRQYPNCWKLWRQVSNDYFTGISIDNLFHTFYYSFQRNGRKKKIVPCYIGVGRTGIIGNVLLYSHLILYQKYEVNKQFPKFARASHPENWFWSKLTIIQNLTIWDRRLTHFIYMTFVCFFCIERKEGEVKEHGLLYLGRYTSDCWLQT